MRVFYMITKIITYPGAFLKGFWEHIACRILKIEVTDRNYLAPDWHCGHVKHEPAMTPAKAFLLTLLPYMAQRMLGWIFIGASFAPILIFGVRSTQDTYFFWLYVVALFFGLSLLCNSFPQWEDAKRQWNLFFGRPTAQEAAAIETLLEQEQAMLSYEEEIGEDAGAEAEFTEEIGEPAEIIDIEPIDLPLGLPKYAGLFGKIVLTPCNAWFLAGAWLEKWGVPTVLALGIVIMLLILQ